MSFYDKEFIHIILQVGKSVILFIIGGIVIHTLIMLFDYFLVPEPLYLDLRKNFTGSIFSTPMIPMIFVYGASFLTIHFLWSRTKKAMLLVQKKEIQREKVELVFQSLQHITGLLAEHIAVYNAEIMGWIEYRKVKGYAVSKKVEKPAKNIARALESLSKLSFILPYTGNIPENTGDIEKMLNSKLDIIMNSKE
jgi:hypothetical protein